MRLPNTGGLGGMPRYFFLHFPLTVNALLTLRWMNRMPSLFHFQGELDEAEPLYWQSLAIREKALGQDHPDVAASLNNLALLLENKVFIILCLGVALFLCC